MKLVAFLRLTLLSYYLIFCCLAEDFDEFQDIDQRKVEESINSPKVETKSEETIDNLIIGDGSEKSVKGRSFGTRFSVTRNTILGDYIWGLGKNTVFADTWVSQNLSALQSHFAYIGPACTEKEAADGVGGVGKNNKLYFIESGGKFSLFVSGNRSCVGMTITLMLRPRMDLLMSILHVLVPQRDSVCFEAVLSEKTEADPLSLVLCGKGKFPGIQKAQPFVKEFVSLVSLPDIPQGLQLYSESGEGAKELLAPFLLPALAAATASTGRLEELLVTDQNTVEVPGFEGVPSRVLRAKFELPRKKGLGGAVSLVEALLQTVDLAGRLRLSAGAKATVQKNRSAIQEREDKKEFLARQVEAEKKRNERLTKEREAERQRYEAMTPEQRVRHDEAEEKKRKKEQLQKLRPKKM